jgi:hypothetical protein
MANQAFLQARLETTETQIIAYEDAIAALLTGGVQQYTLNTGQSVVSVTKLNLSSLERSLSALYQRYQSLCILTGNQSGGGYMRPAS